MFEDRSEKNTRSRLPTINDALFTAAASLTTNPDTLLSAFPVPASCLPACLSACLPACLPATPAPRYFGERALIKEEPRKATIKAVGEVECLVRERVAAHNTHIWVKTLLNTRDNSR